MNFKNLHKDKWQKVRFDEIVKNIKEKYNGNEPEINRFVAGEHMNTDDFKIKSWGILNEDYIGSAFTSKFKPGQVLYGSRRTYLRKVSIPDFHGVCANTTFVLEAKKEKLLHKLLPFIMQSDAFNNFSIKSSKGSTNPYIVWNDLTKFEFHLPDLEAQKNISVVFNKVEETIEQSEKQEKALVEYRKEMVNTIFNHNEDFGTLLPKEKKHVEHFGKVAKNIQKSDFNPLENGLTRFVGLEHIITDNLNITSWGNIADGTTFTKTFKTGQILFGKRRAYLKKVAVANFAGLCSGDILVFDAIEKKLLPELLPYLMQNDAFFEYAVKNSAGSISPRAKWQDLVNFQFYLPNLEIQPRLVSLFKKIDNTIEQTRKHKEKLVAFKKGLLNELIG